MTREPQQRYRWEAKPGALAGLTTGFIDVYNQSQIGCPSRGEAGERGSGELTVGVMFRDLMVVEPGVYRLVVCVCTYACMHACMYVCTHVRMYACMWWLSRACIG